MGEGGSDGQGRFGTEACYSPLHAMRPVGKLVHRSIAARTAALDVRDAICDIALDGRGTATGSGRDTGSQSTQEALHHYAGASGPSGPSARLHLLLAALEAIS